MNTVLGFFNRMIRVGSPMGPMLLALILVPGKEGLLFVEQTLKPTRRWLATPMTFLPILHNVHICLGTLLLLQLTESQLDNNDYFSPLAVSRVLFMAVKASQ